LFSYCFLLSFVAYELCDEVYDYDVLLWMRMGARASFGGGWFCLCAVISLVLLAGQLMVFGDGRLLGMRE
jgi:hypothetical protein